jgi:hypothetical protein
MIVILNNVLCSESRYGSQISAPKYGGRVARLAVGRNICVVLVRKPKERRLPKTPKYSYEYDIKMDLNDNE